MQREIYEELESVFSDLYRPYEFEEKMYFVFQDAPNKIEFINKVESEFLPTLRIRRKQNEGLGNYGRNRMMLYDDAINFLNTWLDKTKPAFGLMLTSVDSPQPKADDSLPENNFSKKDWIKNAFAFTLENDPRKHEQILSNDDFDKLINWVSYFFQNGLQLPDIKTPIKEVNTAKGNIIYTFKKLFKELHPERSYPDELFQLIQKCFFPYRNDKIQNMKKTKEPIQYQKLINNK